MTDEDRYAAYKRAMEADCVVKGRTLHRMRRLVKLAGDLAQVILEKNVDCGGYPTLEMLEDAASDAEEIRREFER